jgi:hypothetical protein
LHWFGAVAREGDELSGYTPVFDSVYDGTLCGRWPALPVWLSILPMADKNGHIDRSYAAIAARTGWPLELLKQGIADLMSPDPESRTPDCDGRRLELLDPENRQWGWRVINHGQYRNKARKAAYDADRTASGADADRKRQQREASRHVPTSPDMSRVVPPSDSDANTDLNSDSEKNKDMSDAKPPDPIVVVFDHWRSTWNHPDSKLDPKRRARIAARLATFTVAQLCDAISGFRNSDWHRGLDPKGGGKIYDKVETLLRDDSQVEEGMRLFTNPPRARNTAEVRLEANVDAMNQFLAGEAS